MKKQLLNYMNLPEKRAVILQSGGLDSIVVSTLLTWAGFEAVEVFVDYGQKALDKELEYAQRHCDYLGRKLEIVHLDIPWFKNQAIIDGTVDNEGKEFTKNNKVNPDVHISMRNHMLLSIAGSLAESLQYKYICSGLNGYQTLLGRPKLGFVDAHKNFIKKLEKSLNEGSAMKWEYKNKLKLLTPLIGMSKREIIELGFEIFADFENSWSCYNNDDKPCLKCGSCITRAEGFELVFAEDPLLEKLDMKISKNLLFNK